MPTIEIDPIDRTDVCGYCGRSEHITSEPLYTLVVKGLGGHPDGIYQDDQRIGTTYDCACGAWCDHEDGETPRWKKKCAYCNETVRTIWEDYQPDEPCKACRDVLRGALKLMKEVRG